MPRDVSGNYTLPSGNPVVDGTIIDVSWANPTMSDIAVQLNNVITRDGVLGATNPIKFASGAAAAPGITFTADPALGVYRVGSGVLGITAAGALVASFATAGIGLFQNLGVGSPSNAGFLAPIDVTTSSGSLGVLIRGRSADGTSMLQFAANNGTTIYGQIQGLSTDFRYAAVNVPHIWFGGGSGTTEHMRLTALGFLGLGRTPTSLLDVYAASGNVTSTIESGSANSVSVALRTKNATRSWMLGVSPGIGTDTWTLYDETAAAVRMVVNSSGYVGIGATDPSTILEVRGDGSTITTNTTVNSSFAGLRIDSSGSEVGSVKMHPNSGEMRHVAGFTAWGGYHTFWTNGVQRAVIDTSGKLGVGVTPGNSTCGVADHLTVSGSAPYIALSNNQSATPAYLQYNVGTSALELYSQGAINLTSVAAIKVNGIEVGWRSVPRASYSASPGAAYSGQCMAATGGVTIPSATFAAGDAVSVYNDSGSAITLTQGSGLTLRLAGTTTTGSRNLDARGIATLWFNSPSEAIVSGSGVS